MLSAVISPALRPTGFACLTTHARIGGGGGPPPYIPGLNFADARNSQYISIISYI